MALFAHAVDGGLGAHETAARWQPELGAAELHPVVSIDVEVDEAGRRLAVLDRQAQPLRLLGRQRQAKRRCLTIEERDPAARLVDLDVYDRDGAQLGRAQLGLPTRRCLICGEAAVDCMREKRHPLEAIVARTDELLVTYRA